MRGRMGSALIVVVLAAGCRGASPGMWAEHGLPAPDESWSAATVRAEPELAPGGRLTIDRACEIALAHHPDVALGRGMLAAADARIGQALADYLPQIGVSSSYLRATDNPASGAGRSAATRIHWHDGDDSHRSSLDASQTLADGGGIRAATRRARHEALAAAHDAGSAAADVLLKVRETYLTYMAERALLEVAQETQEGFQRHLREAERFHEVGRGTRADVAKARVDLGGARLELVRARNRVALARLALNRAMGLEEDPGYETVDEIPPRRLAIDAAQAVAQARETRPALRAARERMLAAEERVRETFSAYLPALTFGASLGMSGERLPLVGNWSLGPSLQWDLLDGLRTPRRVREAKALLRAARAEVAALEQQVYEEVHTALLSLQEADERLAVASETLASAEESLRLTAGRYRVGRSSLLEQTDAELALAGARAEGVRARHDYERAVARLLRAIGMAHPTEAGIR